MSICCFYMRILLIYACYLEPCTAQNFETPNCRKIDDRNPNNSANTDIYAYSETTIGGPTVGYGMTEN